MYMHTKKFKILCIDGGGIKGLYSARLLAKFEEVFDCVISDRFDMLCGTSTGGIIALAASLKIPMSDVVKFYQEHGPYIFNERAKNRMGGSAFLRSKQIVCGGKTLRNLCVLRLRVFSEIGQLQRVIISCVFQHITH